MLVLSRRVGEVVRIGDGISVRICEVSGERVKLGIVAPRDVRVLREELLNAEPGVVREPGDDLPVRGDVRDSGQPGVRDGGAAAEGVPPVREEGVDP